MKRKRLVDEVAYVNVLNLWMSGSKLTRDQIKEIHSLFDFTDESAIVSVNTHLAKLVKKSEAGLVNENEVAFISIIKLWTTGRRLTQEEVKEIHAFFDLNDEDIIGCANSYLNDLIKKIEARSMSLADFSQEDAKIFANFMGNSKLDRQLQSKLNRLIYGADERARYFEDK